MFQNHSIVFAIAGIIINCDLFLLIQMTHNYLLNSQMLVKYLCVCIECFENKYIEILLVLLLDSLVWPKISFLKQ